MSQAIRKHLRKRPRGKPFVARELLQFGTRDVVHQVLSRLTREGYLERVGHGIYVKPEQHPVLGKMTVPTVEVVKAVARARNETIRNSGAAAANKLGLSTQIPTRPVYLTSGRSRRLRVGNQTVELHHAAGHYLRSGTLAGEVVRCLRYLGKHGVTPEQLEQLRGQLTDKHKSELSSMLNQLPAWMGGYIRKLID